MSHQFKVEDRIRIARQPTNQWVSVKGEVGLIEEIHGDLCDVRTFNISPEGGCGGWGTVPLDCLESFSSPLLERQILDWKNRIEKAGREARVLRNKRVHGTEK